MNYELNNCKYLSRNYKGLGSAGNKAKTDIEKIMDSMYNPQIEMFARFKMKSSFHKTKRII